MVPQTTVLSSFTAKLMHPFTAEGQSELPRVPSFGVISLSQVFSSAPTMAQIELDNSEELSKYVSYLSTFENRAKLCAVDPRKQDNNDTLLMAYHTLSYLTFGLGFSSTFSTKHAMYREYLKACRSHVGSAYEDTISTTALFAPHYAGHCIKQMVLPATLYALAYKKALIK